MGKTNKQVTSHSRGYVAASLTLSTLLATTRLINPVKAYADANVYAWTKQGGLDLLGGSYTSAAGSADGSRMILGTSNGGTGDSEPSPLFISSNYGATWENVAGNADSGIRDSWTSVAVSDDGQTMVAASSSGTNIQNSNGVNGKILISHDGGTTWANISPAGPTQWNNIAISGDGNKIVAVANDDTGHVYITENGGTTWATSASTTSVTSWQSISMSDNGNKILVGGENSSTLSSMIDISTDGGTTWTDVSPDASGNGQIITVSRGVLSSNGNEIALSTYGYNTNWYDTVKVSSDDGANWTDVTPDNTNVDEWTAIALSGNGSTLSVLNDTNDAMFISGDTGAHWTHEDPDQPYGDSDTNAWDSISISANGTHSIVASAANAYTGHNGTAEANSTTFANAGNGGMIVLTTPSGTNITCNSTVSEASLSTKDNTYSYPLGLVDFCLNEAQALNTVTLTFVTSLKPSDVTLRSYNSNTGQYATVSGASIVETTYQGKPALRVTYTIPDNGLLDTNPNFGTVSDPIGLGVLAAKAPNTGFGYPSSKATPIVYPLTLMALGAGFLATQVRRKIKLF